MEKRTPLTLDLKIRKSPFQILGENQLWEKLKLENGRHLLPSQYEALLFVEKWANDEKRNMDPCLLVLPTGTGKKGITILAPVVLSSSKVLILTPSTVLRDRLAKDLSGFSDMFLVKNEILELDFIKKCNLIPVVFKIEGIFTWTTITDDVIISDVEKFAEDHNSINWSNASLFGGIDLVIVEEAHKLPTSFWTNIVNACHKEKKKLILLTASPFRTNGTFIEPLKFLEENKFYYRLSLSDASKRNLIRQIKIHPLTGITDILGTFFFDEHHISVTLEEPPERMKRNGADLMILRKVVELLNHKDILYPLPNGQKHRALILSQSLEESHKLKCMLLVKLLGMKEKAAIYQNKSKEKRKDVDRFLTKVGPERILIVAERLNEYLDMPEISVVAICSPVASPYKFYQFVGRGLQRVRSGTKSEDIQTHCDIIYHSEIYSSCNKMLELFLAENLIEDMEEKLKGRYFEKGGEPVEEYAGSDDETIFNREKLIKSA